MKQAGRPRSRTWRNQLAPNPSLARRDPSCGGGGALSVALPPPRPLPLPAQGWRTVSAMQLVSWLRTNSFFCHYHKDTGSPPPPRLAAAWGRRGTAQRTLIQRLQQGKGGGVAANPLTCGGASPRPPGRGASPCPEAPSHPTFLPPFASPSGCATPRPPTACPALPACCLSEGGCHFPPRPAHFRPARPPRPARRKREREGGGRGKWGEGAGKEC